MSPFDQSASEARRQASRRLKALATELWAAGEDDLITVSELRCTEPGCPPLETVVGLFPTHGERRQIKIHRPLLDVTEADLRQAVAGSGHAH